MSWNHRVVRHVNDSGESAEPWYAIHEVHYDENGKPTGWTANHIAPGSESLSGLMTELGWMLQACGKPILTVKGKRLVKVAGDVLRKDDGR